MGQQRMRTSRFRKSPYQHLLARLKKQQLDGMSQIFDSLQDAHEIRKKYPFPDIDAQRHTGDLSLLLIAEIDERGQQGRWKIVDAEIARILTRLKCEGLTRAGQSTDND
jgi:hypothetical protein